MGRYVKDFPYEGVTLLGALAQKIRCRLVLEEGSTMNDVFVVHDLGDGTFTDRRVW